MDVKTHIESIRKVQLKFSSIQNVPLESYPKDFTFIVNGEEFQTCQFISDLLSPKICLYHKNDPTINHFFINTDQPGDFSHVLKLISFEEFSPSESEIDFIIEVLEQLGTDSIAITEEVSNTEITKENVFIILSKHQKHSTMYSKQISVEIEYLSSHFSELYEEEEENMINLGFDTLERIIKNDKLQLKNEDQLLHFVNKLYQKDPKYESFYEHVLFANVSSEMMTEFINIFDFNDLSRNAWNSLCSRLANEIKQSENAKQERYTKKNDRTETKGRDKAKSVLYEEGRELNGIIKCLTDETGSNIHDNGTIELTSNYSCLYPPRNLLDFNQNNCYSPYSHKDAFVCFDFKNKEIEITNYSIKSANKSGYIKNWVIEISKDGKNWSIIDEQSEYSGLNGDNIIKTFPVKPNEFSRYVRLRLTGDFWDSALRNLRIGCIEFYGYLKDAK